MTKKTRAKLWSHLAALGLALVLVVALSLSALAASPQVEDVLGRLSQLQRANIDPAWGPDISANSGLVQGLLTSFEACTDAERAEFTDEQMASLRSYFEALYLVQGKAAAGVDNIFDGGAPAAVSSSSSSSSAPPSSSQASSSQASSSSAASSPSSVAESSSVPASSSLAQESSSASVPVVVAPVSSLPEDASGEAPAPSTPQNQPQAPGEEGWLGLFGNNALGTALLMILLVLAVVLFVRFLVALRRNKAALKQEEDKDARAKELFGENYDPQELDESGEEDVPLPEEDTPPPLDFGGIAPQGGYGGFEDVSENPVSFRDEMPHGDAHLTGLAPAEAEEEMNSGGWFGRKRAEKKAKKEREEALSAAVGIKEPIIVERELPKDAPAEKPAAGWAAPGTMAAQTQANVQDMLRQQQGEEEERHQPPPEIGRNPETQNSITMRSFSAPPRTGKPSKMPFRQGDPEDIDAIDE